MPPKRKVNAFLQHGDSGTRTLRSKQIKLDNSKENELHNDIGRSGNLQSNENLNLRQYGIFPPKFNGEGDYETWWSKYACRSTCIFCCISRNA